MYSSNSGSPKSYAHESPITYGFNRAWDQSEWHVDPINGNDLNVGDTRFNPIKNANEYHKRVGTVHEYNKAIKMTIYSSLLPSDILNLTGLRCTAPNDSIYFSVVGIPKVVATGVATVRSFNFATNTQWGLSCNSLGNLSQYIKPGSMVRKTSGSLPFNTSLWLTKNENGVIARATEPAYILTPEDPTGMGQGTIATGDSFEIVELPQVTQFMSGTDLSWWPGGLSLRGLHFNSISTGISGGTFFLGNIYFRECAISGYYINNGGYQTLNSCQMQGIRTQHGPMTYLQYGVVQDGILENTGTLGIQYGTILQNCPTVTLYPEEGALSALTCHGGGGFGIFDSPGNALTIGTGSQAILRYPVWGSGNAGHPLEIQYGAELILATPGAYNFVLTGGIGLSDIILGDDTSGPAVDPATNLYTAPRAYSFPNLIQTVALGGFEGRIFDPLSPRTSITRGY